MGKKQKRKRRKEFNPLLLIPIILLSAGIYASYLEITSSYSTHSILAAFFFIMAIGGYFLLK